MNNGMNGGMDGNINNIPGQPGSHTSHTSNMQSGSHSRVVTATGSLLELAEDTLSLNDSDVDSLRQGSGLVTEFGPGLGQGSGMLVDLGPGQGLEQGHEQGQGPGLGQELGPGLGQEMDPTGQDTDSPQPLPQQLSMSTPPPSRPPRVMMTDEISFLSPDSHSQTGARAMAGAGAGGALMGQYGDHR